jgi:hypothetical protein
MNLNTTKSRQAIFEALRNTGLTHGWKLSVATDKAFDFETQLKQLGYQVTPIKPDISQA